VSVADFGPSQAAESRSWRLHLRPSTSLLTLPLTYLVCSSK